MPWLQLAAIVVGGMIGAGIFSLPRTFANATGPMGAVIAWLIAGTGMYMLARVFQALAERKPEIDTGVYAYAREGFGDSPGFVSVTCVMVLVTLLPYAVLANTRFKGGIESFLSVLDSERQLFGAKLDPAAVQRDRLLTLVQIYKALGGGAEILREPHAAGNAAALCATR